MGGGNHIHDTPIPGRGSVATFSFAVDPDLPGTDILSTNDEERITKAKELLVHF